MEVHEHFRKQTYRNRCRILTANGILNLSVPVHYGNRTPFKDVKIDHSQSWSRDHIRAIGSSYAKAPFFDHLVHEYFEVYKKNHLFLYDLNLEILTICLKHLQYDIQICETEKYEEKKSNEIIDHRNDISAKEGYKSRHIYRPVTYLQNFGNKFVPNLSVLDCILCQGLTSFENLKASSIYKGEQM